MSAKCNLHRSKVHCEQNTAEDLGYKPCGWKTKPLKVDLWVRIVSQFSHLLILWAPEDTLWVVDRELKMGHI